MIMKTTGQNGHLTSDQLASLAASGASEPAHISSCAACREELDGLRGVVDDLRAMPDPPDQLVEAAKAYFRARRRLEDLIESLLDDPALRAKASARPEAVLRDAGIEPTPELVAAISGARAVSRDLAKRLAAKSLWG
jgi:hypothetical protein